ncbi:F-box protein [Hirschfeldia incana]|nr:F-box protein [Hirschfeldia incana]
MALSNGEFEITFSHGKLQGTEEEVVRLGFLRFTRGLGSKRILFSKSNQETVSNSNQLDSSVKIPLKRSKTEPNSSVLESLHQDILIRVLCHVDHDDLERLKRVSKTIRNAVLEAKKSHFDYSTPRKTLPFRDQTSIVEQDKSLSDQDDAIEPPNAPFRRRKVNHGSDLSRISMVLFK